MTIHKTSWGHERSQTKFGPDRFSRLLDTHKQTDSINRLGKNFLNYYLGRSIRKKYQERIFGFDIRVSFFELIFDMDISVDFY